MLVRLKPLDQKLGHILRRYCYDGIHFRFDAGWYSVSEKHADYLRTIRQIQTKPHSPPAFDVCTEAEAEAMDAQAAADAEPRKPADGARPAIGRSEKRIAKAQDVAPSDEPAKAVEVGETTAEPSVEQPASDASAEAEPVEETPVAPNPAPPKRRGRPRKEKTE